ncbi:hypothetical protein F8R89_30895 [Streptomyces sp. SS1-1]|uniref:DUF6221 family protein n=1 Tax=Streptomyces sp. SS1-1 TaxID=2651869 RepID=UPI0012509761|nr:DUF6221 family protein [Streptomyces sp. SS1-1]KAB2976017.1 hypothetical protein F8R89_30895 [Streptomyces sp. SS1-1]
MDELVRWLGEQLDVDAARSTAAAEELGADWYYDDGFVLARREDDMVATGSQDFLERERGEHVATHDPARVLREIDAKRQILEIHHVIGGWEDEDGQDIGLGCNECGYSAEYSDRGGWCDTVRLLALPYADRPGFREKWRP